MSAFAPSTQHKCTRFCHFEHAFGNLFICQTSGAQHVCDSTCDQGVYYDGSHVICRLSKVIRPAQQCEQLDRKRSAVEDIVPTSCKRSASDAPQLTAMQGLW